MTFKRKLKETYVLADYQKWKGRWVHYSNTPYLKVNPDGFHMDPSGIYFFPEAFRTVGDWHKKQYKYVVEVPDNLKVLDLSTINTPETALAFLEKLKVNAGFEYEDFKKQIEGERRNVADIAWEYLQRYFGAANGQKKPGSFNKRLRQAGYEAVFDDTGSIHNSEIQLLLLDPRRFHLVEQQEGKGSGHNYVKEVYDLVLAEGKKYGEVEASDPKKKWESWTNENQITTSITVSTGERYSEEWRYITFKIYASPDRQRSGFKPKDPMKANMPVSQLGVSALYSSPKIEGISLKKSYNEDIRDVKMNEIKDMIEKLLHYIFVEAK